MIRCSCELSSVQMDDALFTLNKALLEHLNQFAKRIMNSFVDTYQGGRSSRKI